MTGRLRVYLGAAPGVGKTYRMLDEGHRRAARGTDVVVGLVETHGRPRTLARLEGLEVLPRRSVEYRGAAFEELDVEAVLARRPDVVLVDELAHSNVLSESETGRHPKRWQDVQDLLAAGLDVITTVNVQHLESLNDVVEEITGIRQQETVPDAVVRAAEQIELVDMTPEALRRRMAHGNVYPPEKVDAALGNYFRTGNLTALRELALLWLADKVDDELDDYRLTHRIGKVWEARERVVVALPGGPEGETLIRRAARVARRTKGADLLAVHVTRSDGLRAEGLRADPAQLSRQRRLVEDLGGSYHQVIGTDIATALLDFARGVNATQLVLGTSRRGRLARMLSPGVGIATTAGSGPIDVHLVTHADPHRSGRVPRRGSGLSSLRRLGGIGLVLLGLPLLTAGLLQLRDAASLPTDMLAFLLLVIAAALVGGVWPALTAALCGFVLLNYFFTPPLGVLTVAEREDLVALIAFVVVALAVSTVVDLAARRARDAARARAEAATLFTLAGSVLAGERPLPALLAQLRTGFGLEAVTLLERRPGQADPAADQDPAAWQVVGADGDPPARCPAEGQVAVQVTGTVTLVARGRPLPAADRRVLEAFGAQAAVALREERLQARADEAGELGAVDRLRTALLNAVGHDLRTPLASARAAVSSLREVDVPFTPDDRAELLATAEESLVQLGRLVENLLDMSRLQAGALGMAMQPIDVAETLATALDEVPGAHAVRIVVEEEVPEVLADPALLQRAVVNLLSNALRFSPPGRPPLVSASEHGGQVQVRVVDHGPGVTDAEREGMFQPFQRLGDRDTSSGVGLGLALSRGLVEAMGGAIDPETTPGGGLTMVITLAALTGLAGLAGHDPLEEVTG